MAMTIPQRVGKALEILKTGLAPFVEREMKTAYKDKAASQAALLMGEDRLLAKKPIAEWDVAGLLKLMWDAWNEVFRNTLGHAERSLVSEIRDVRKPHERPSIGVLLCASKDAEVVEYALSRSLSPALVAEYQTRLPDKKLLQAKLHEFYALSEEETE